MSTEAQTDRIIRCVMIRVINLIEWWHFNFSGPTKSARLESWACDREWLEMWPGRKESIEYYRTHKFELEWYWDSPDSYKMHKMKSTLDDIKEQLDALCQPKPKNPPK